MDNENTQSIELEKNESNNKCEDIKISNVSIEDVNNSAKETHGDKEIDSSSTILTKDSEVMLIEETNNTVANVNNENSDAANEITVPANNVTPTETSNSIEDQKNSENTNKIIECKNNETSVNSENDNQMDVVNTNDSLNTKKEDLFYIDKQNPLDVIALQYDSSDSDAEKPNDAKKCSDVSNSNTYRNKEIVILSDCSSDSESDSSSSSEDDSPKICDNVDSDDSDNENQTTGNVNKTKKKVPKGEFDDLPPIEDLKISVPEVLCDPLGKVAWTVEQMVVVSPEPGKPTLNLDTVLFIEKGKRALGHIFDVFGQVTEPHYCVRFNSSDHIRESDIKVGMTVYYCPNTEYTSLVFLSELRKIKPVDDLGDDEAPQFSDDEEERAYLASLENKSNKSHGTSDGVPNKRRRVAKKGWQSNHPWNSSRQQPQQQGPSPFYRAHHPWSRPRYQHNYNNPWYPSQTEQQLYPYAQNLWAPGYQHPAYGNPQQNYAHYAYTNQMPPEQFQMQQPAAYTAGAPNSYVQLPQPNNTQQAAAYSASATNAQTSQRNPVQQGARVIMQFPIVPPPPPPPESNKD